MRSLEAHRAWLKGDLTQLAAIIDARIEARPDWRFRRDLIRSMPGCGPVFARVAIAELPELGRTEHKRLVSLVGLAPFPKDSGQSRGKRRVRGGRFGVRAALYMSSVSATRTNPVMAAYYGRLVEAGKPRMVARVATMRKMLIALNAMVRDGREWSPPKGPEAELLAS
jgi:transposase